MLDGVEAHTLLFAETQIYRYLQQGNHDNISASIAYLRVVPIPPPSPTALLPLPSLQTTSNISASEEAGYSGQAEVFHAPQPGCPRDRESSLEILRLETEDGAPYLHQDPPTKRVDSSVRAENKTAQTPPNSGASRRQLSLAPEERHQLPPPALERAPPPPPGLSALCSTLDKAPPPELPGPGRPCRPLGHGICSGAGPAGARRCQPDDSAPTSV